MLHACLPPHSAGSAVPGQRVRHICPSERSYSHSMTQPGRRIHSWHLIELVLPLDRDGCSILLDIPLPCCGRATKAEQQISVRQLCEMHFVRQSWCSQIMHSTEQGAWICNVPSAATARCCDDRLLTTHKCLRRQLPAELMRRRTHVSHCSAVSKKAVARRSRHVGRRECCT